MDPAMAALIGSLIGAFAGIGGGLLLEAYRRRRDRQGTASALAGEIASILFMAERRKYVEYFETILPSLDGGVDILIGKFAPDADHPEPVADRLIDKLGLLPRNLPERVVRFYSMVAGIRRDLERMANREVSVSGKATMIREDLAIWTEAVSLGNELVTELQREANGWW